MTMRNDSTMHNEATMQNNVLKPDAITLSNLPKVVDKRKKRVGRGLGSSKGKMSGRGMKGQKARNRIRVGFEGGQTSLVRRLPFLRGRGFRGRHKIRYETVNIGQLSALFGNEETVTIKLLIGKGLVSKRTKTVKILGTGELNKKLKFGDNLIFSARAKQKVEGWDQSLP